MPSDDSLCEKLKNALPCFGKKVADTEMHEKVGADELNKQELVRLESDLKLAKNSNIECQRHRKTNFQKNLNIFASTHNINEVKAKYEQKLEIGQNAKDAREFAERKALHRGSITFDVTPQYRKMKSLLDDPSCQSYLGAFMKKCYMQETLFCWIDCNDFLLIPTTDYRRCKAINIINKYVKPGGTMTVGCLDGDIIEQYEKICELLNDGESANPTLFDKISNACFREMVAAVLEPFKKSKEYGDYVDRKDRDGSSLKILVTDFDYMAILGQGGFGRVVHARKKSTGKHFAVKIQPKIALYEEHDGNLGNLHTEKTVFANCQHPFIVNMCYALQTVEHAILVLSLVDGGDLNDLLWRAPNGRLYTAQIALALAHLHEIGILYRDLKPENVLICGRTGNCMITDMGLAAPIVLADDDDDVDNELTNKFENETQKEGITLAHITQGGIAKNTPYKESRELRSEMKRMSISEDVEVNEISGEILKDMEDEKAKDEGDEDSSEEEDFDLAEEEIKDIAEKALVDGELSSRERAGKRKNSFMVQTAKLGESATNKTLKQLEELAKNAGHGTGQVIEEDKEIEDDAVNISPVKMTEIEAAKKRIKRMSVVGTRGFMAPEIVEGKALKRKDRRGYDETADWFALGVTTYVMLTGGQPFAGEDPTNVSAALLEKEFPRDASGKIKRPQGFASLMQTVKFPSFMSHAACHFCKGLMDIHPEDRTGRNGISDLHKEDWFVRSENPASAERLRINRRMYKNCELDCMTFDKVMNLGYPVPEWVYKTARSKALGKVYERNAKPKYNHYEHMMATFDIRSHHQRVDWYGVPKQHQQEIFESWDFMSMDALKDELTANAEHQDAVLALSNGKKK
ncbi:hypothetical protein TL16_g01930 [Triparma laevis f. inornata]|uniref:Uncharacterized protein n=2 Tax=Triparma laevis TaxID=1534972 RepID=A0A9W7AFT0_9STRA|nr:hypothetical protein TL16_g01930 [Triparma laevis f. inornata]GMH71976.1 hypothetical protein TrLO_g6939 [Triparma laevis f. longispina]